MRIILLLGLLLAAELQDAQSLVDKLRSESIAEREQAERQLLDLGPAALAALKNAANDPDSEVASRAKMIVQLIGIRSRIPAEVLKAKPGVEREILRGRRTLFELFSETLGSPASRAAYSPAAVSAFVTEVVKDPLSPPALVTVINVVGESRLKDHWKFLVRVIDDPTIKDDPKGRGPRSAAASALGGLEVPESTPDLLRFLSHGSADVRASTIGALAAMRVREAIPRMHELLKDANFHVRHEAIDALVELDPKGLQPKIPGLIEADDGWCLVPLAEAVQKFELVDSVPSLIEKLNEKVDPSRSPRVAEILLQMRRKEVVPVVLRFLEADPRTFWAWPTSPESLLWKTLEELKDETTWPLVEKYLTSPKPDARAKALEILATYRPTEAVAHSLKLLKDPMATVRARAIEELARLDRPEFEKRLEAFLADGDPDVRVAALRSAKRAGRKEEIELAARSLKDPNLKVRSEAIAKLVRLEANEREDDLAVLLKDESQYVRTHAARALALLHSTKYAKEVFETLGRAQSRDRIRGLSSSEGGAVGILLRLPEKALATEVTRHVDGPDLETFSFAVEIAERWGMVEALPSLRKALEAKDAGVRARAAKALGALGDRVSGRALVGLLKDPDRRVRYEAVDALGKLRAAEVADLLPLLKESELWHPTLGAVLAIGPREPIPDLANLLETRRPHFGDKAFKLAVLTKDRSLQRLAMEALGSDHPEVRQSAATYLKELGFNQDCDALLELLAKKESTDAAAWVLASAPRAKIEGQVLALLSHHRSEVRRGATEVIRRGRWMDLRPKLIERLVEGDWQSFASAYYGLIEMGVQGCEKEIEAALAHASPRVRMGAAQILLETHAARWWEKVEPLTRDPDGDVRRNIINKAGELGIHAAAAAAVELLKDSDKYVVQRASYALRCLGAREVAPPLIKLIKDGPREATEAAIEIVADFELREASPEIRPLADQERDSEAKAKYIRILGLLRDVEAVTRLCEWANPESFEVGPAALVALGRIGSPECIRFLETSLAKGDEYFRAAAIRGLSLTSYAEDDRILRLYDRSGSSVDQAVVQYAWRKRLPQVAASLGEVRVGRDHGTASSRSDSVSLFPPASTTRRHRRQRANRLRISLRGLDLPDGRSGDQGGVRDLVPSQTCPKASPPVGLLRATSPQKALAGRSGETAEMGPLEVSPAQIAGAVRKGGSRLYRRGHLPSGPHALPDLGLGGPSARGPHLGQAGGGESLGWGGPLQPSLHVSLRSALQRRDLPRVSGAGGPPAYSSEGHGHPRWSLVPQR